MKKNIMYIIITNSDCSHMIKPTTSSCKMVASVASISATLGEVRYRSPCTNSFTYMPADVTIFMMKSAR